MHPSAQSHVEYFWHSVDAECAGCLCEMMLALHATVCHFNRLRHPARIQGLLHGCEIGAIWTDRWHDEHVERLKLLRTDFAAQWAGNVLHQCSFREVVQRRCSVLSEQELCQKLCCIFLLSVIEMVSQQIRTESFRPWLLVCKCKSACNECFFSQRSCLARSVNERSARISPNIFVGSHSLM